MSRRPSALTRSGLIALERRLARARPRPAPAFARRIGRSLSVRWAQHDRPRRFHAQVLTLLVSGAGLLIAALAIALSR
jgi:hypothetical protein